MKFNINDTVRVRLTDYGRAVLRDDWQSTTNIYYGSPEQRAIRGEYKPPKEDAHGWSEWQLWALMGAFGEYTYLGATTCFETEIEIVGAEVAKAEADLAQRTAELAALKACVDRKDSLLDATIRNLRTVEAERDEARRKWCELASAFGASNITAEGLAKERGWDCFATHANTTDVPVQNGGE